jgi:hypothetical protein
MLGGDKPNSGTPQAAVTATDPGSADDDIPF